MKKLFVLVTVLVFFSFLPRLVNAKGMMGGYQNSNQVASAEATSSTAQDEAAGKAVWDKLQSKQLSCSDLKDDDFDVVGDFFMGNMSGSNHESMNQIMAQRLGDDGEKQMHIAMGKRLSGCDKSAAWPNGNNNMFARNSNRMMGNPFGVFGLITWIGLMTFLISGSIFFLRELLAKKSK